MIPLVAIIGGIVGLARRAAVAPPHRRLPRDRDALLLPGLPDRHEQRRRRLRRERHERAERDPQRRRVHALRLGLPRSTSEGLFNVALPLRRARLLRPRLRRAAPPQRLPHGSRVALAPRGPARGRADGDAGQPAQADGVRVRGGGRGADRDVRDRAQRQRLPAELRVPAADHRLHDGDPRRGGQPGRRRPRRRDRQRPARGAARRGRRARRSSTSSSCSRSSPRSGTRSKLAIVLGGTIVFGIVAQARWPARSTTPGRSAPSEESGRLAAVGGRLGDRARELDGWVAAGRATSGSSRSSSC